MRDSYIKALDALKLQAKALSGDDNYMIDQELLEKAQSEMEKYEPFTSKISARMMEVGDNKITIDTADLEWLQKEFGF